jgi:hypothetical protein
MGIEYTFSGVCSGKTKKGLPCKHIVVYANGLCKQHGGSSLEFMRERFQKINAKATRRMKRKLRGSGRPE